ncbi:glycoside hydrolase family 17 protein [Nemania abortiva]|nr:glycoside hydrolase family 17 protein [Nemania abortiva]
MRLFAIFIALLSLLHLSLGQPAHRHGGYRHRANRAFVQKRDRITMSDAAFPKGTELPEVVIYVDQYGNPIRTATETVVYMPMGTPAPKTSSLTNLPPPSSVPPQPDTAPPVVAPAPVLPPSPSPLSAEPAPEPSSKQQPGLATPAVTPASSPLSESVPQPDPYPTQPYTYPTQPDTYPTQPDTPLSGSGLHGVTYSPYKGDGNCKTEAEVDRDFSLFSKDYGVVRLYGVDCDQVSTVSKAAKKYGNKLLLGIFDINNVDSAVDTMATSLNYDWSMVDTVSVGNELVNNGAATTEQSLTALATARTCLRARGFQGPVVVVDTFVAVLAHPELCDQSDYCAVNVHPFFDPNTGAPDAGTFVNSMIQKIRGKLSDPSKRIVVTETGWPWQGEPNGAAIPGLDHQSVAISSIKGAFSSNAADVFLFTAFNDLWKKPEASTFMAEQFWGMGGRYSPSDE